MNRPTPRQPFSRRSPLRSEVRSRFSSYSARTGFGANWCEDCRALDLAIKSGRSAELLARQFKVVKVDIGNFDRNLDLVAAYGNPIKKGIPAAVVLSPDNEVLYATRAGELADARRMSESGIYDFLRKVTRTTKKRSATGAAPRSSAR